MPRGGGGGSSVSKQVRGKRSQSKNVRRARQLATRPKSGSKSKGKSKTRGKSSKDSY